MAPKSKKSSAPQKANFFQESVKKKSAGVSDMTLLTKINNENIGDNLDKRFNNQEIYTYIGHVLISVNPFRDLGIYTDEVLKSYQGKNRLEMPPHVFAIAESAYYTMNAYKENQCIIISGESGAGKTEAAKRIMQYIATVSGGESSQIKEIKDMVLATNPLLESFGCAKTLRNNNSSRHGKYLEIQFNAQGEPVGAVITNYLLEKASNRVVGQIDNERNFHIFYQYCKAASPNYQEQFGMTGPESFLLTNKSGCLSVDGIDDVHDFGETIEAMRVIGLSQQEQDEIFRMLAIILWLGNVQFVENDEEYAQITDNDVIAFIAYIMEVDSGMLIRTMTTRIVETQRGGRRGSTYESPMNVVQAGAVRDAFCKAIYNNLFEWIVSRVNVSLRQRGAHSYTIGVLDIYGFEIFEENSFEQLCINYVNEKLQQIFIELTLKTEQEEYVREKIQWTPIEFFNNKVVCDLIEERRPPGIFATMNDACATAHADSNAADNALTQRLTALSSNPHFESRGSSFLVKHYAGDVMYQISGMTDKNKDVLSKDILTMIASSNNQFFSSLFPEPVDLDSKKRPPTAGDKIKSSAGLLVQNLMQCTPSYIRTIKPNSNKSPKEFDTKMVLHQVKYLGLCENIRVRRAGFASRQTFEKFLERFYLLSPKTSYAGEYVWKGDPKGGVVQVLKDTNIAPEEWQLGVTKVFIRHPETLFSLEHLRDRYWHNMATRIQRAWRNYMQYKNECAIRIQRCWRKNKDQIQWLQLREYGHQVLAGRKERRRYSLVSQRRYFGDYLGVNNKGGPGQLVKAAVGLTDLGMKQLTVVFLTGFNMYLVMSQLVGKAVVMKLERTIMLNSIKSVSISNLRDGWMIFSVDTMNPEEGDIILECDFKNELVAHLLQRSGGRIGVNVGPQAEYVKKKGKMATVKFVKDERAKTETYKSHVVTVPNGEPASSASWPPCERMAKPVRPITSGKLLKKGGPQKSPMGGGGARRPPTSTSGMASVAGAAMNDKSTSVQAPMKTPSAVTPPASAAKRQPPPPPPAPVAEAPPPPPSKPMYKAIYNFVSEDAGEVSFVKDDVMEILEKDDNGWWLAKKDGKEGWVPSNYLVEVPAPKPTPPPALPAKRNPPPPPPAATAAATVMPVGSNSKPAAPRHAPVKTNGAGSSVAASASTDAIHAGFGGPGNIGGVPGWKVALEAKKAAAAAAAGGQAHPPAPAPAGASSNPTPAARRAGPPAVAPKPSVGPKPVIPPRAPAGGPKPTAPARPTGGKTLQEILAARRQQNDDE
ncbi:class II myosin [Lunasporangiospora selenospora]|uniref:Class II myosin n=1 Tax=Lunasporangiospora selenospora TaxID=979761 RepID=A0A9P6FYU2_9FUNG|nr:class II myosin [Lunasporangiospora selenospora]